MSRTGAWTLAGFLLAIWLMSGCGVTGNSQVKRAARRSTVVGEPLHTETERTSTAAHVGARSLITTTTPTTPASVPGQNRLSLKPGSAGRLVRSIAVRLVGGRSLAPVGELHGSGQAVVDVYGDSEICWHFSRLSGLHRPTFVAVAQVLSEGPSHAVATLPSLVLGQAKASGCRVGVAASAVEGLLKEPSRYLLTVGDSVATAAVGGRL